MRIPYHSSHVRSKMSKEFNLIVCFSILKQSQVWMSLILKKNTKNKKKNNEL